MHVRLLNVKRWKATWQMDIWAIQIALSEQLHTNLTMLTGSKDTQQAHDQRTLSGGTRRPSLLLI